MLSILRAYLKAPCIPLLIIASIGLAAGLCTGCASVPPSKERPQIGCEFDTQQRWRYALIVERGDEQTRWVSRVVMTQARDPYDKEEHVSASIRVRAGYCPDESASLMTGRVPGTFGEQRP